ncbi:UNVERIFIED_CONTAM: hypothetical protein K2H54_055695 [Gekko kuhli]
MNRILTPLCLDVSVNAGDETALEANIQEAFVEMSEQEQQWVIDRTELLKTQLLKSRTEQQRQSNSAGILIHESMDSDCNNLAIALPSQELDGNRMMGLEMELTPLTDCDQALMKGQCPDKDVEMPVETRPNRLRNGCIFFDNDSSFNQMMNSE